MFSLVQQSYQAGWYTLDNVRTFVLANMITKDEYKEITGQDYDQPQQTLSQLLGVGLNERIQKNQWY